MFIFGILLSFSFLSIYSTIISATFLFLSNFVFISFFLVLFSSFHVHFSFDLLSPPTREGVQRPHEPCINDLWASRFAEKPPGSVPLDVSPSLRHSVSNKKFLAFTFTKNHFSEKSEHGKIVQNDTQTICIKKSILIEIKGFISVFLNFTNSLNCEEIFQFCKKIVKFYIISQGFHQSNHINGNSQNTVVFVNSYNLCFYCMLSKILKNFFFKLKKIFLNSLNIYNMLY